MTTITTTPVDRESTVLLTGDEAVATAAKLSRVAVVPAYPITPQTKIVETIADMVASGEFKTEFVPVESEHSAMAAAIGSSLAGSRTFTATSSHGLLYMGELVFWAGLTRIPIVMANVNRSLNPWNIWADHSDAMAFRDAGWILMWAKNNQEVLDLTIQAFKISENHKIWMPTMVCLDAFILSHTSSQVIVPSQDDVDRFLPKFNPLVMLDPEKPFAHGSLSDDKEIVPLRESVMEGFNSARVIIPQVFGEYKEIMGRWDERLVEITGDPEEATVGVVCLGTMGEEAEMSVSYLEKKGIKSVAIRPRVTRPFPKKELKEILSKLDKVVIIDRSCSFGNEGQMAIEIKALLFEEGIEIEVYPRIMGLGGADVNYVHIAQKIEEVI